MLAHKPLASPSSYTVTVILQEDKPQNNTDWGNVKNCHENIADFKRILDRSGVLCRKTLNTCEFEIPFDAYVSVSFILRAVWSIIPAFINLNGELLFWNPNLDPLLLFYKKKLLHGSLFAQKMPIEGPFVIQASLNGIYFS